jgi:hypothetical protein
VHTPPASPAQLTDGTGAVGGGTTQQRSMRGDGGKWPLLTHTNYADWAVLMQVMLEGRLLWDAIDNGIDVRSDDRLATILTKNNLISEV